MNTQLEIADATRVGITPWIDLYSESGCGKTMSALLLARGLAGPTGKIVLADSESKRGSLYADVIPGGYKVINFNAPFSPATYLSVAEAIAASGAAVGIIDSMSHEWEGVGGVLDMAAEAESKSGKPGLHNWRVPKMEHAKLVNFLLRFPIPLVCCIRAKFKTRQSKENGKTVIIKDDHVSPIQSEEFIFEATAHAEILPDHSIHLSKCSHPALRECFPSVGPITIETGEAIARWCAAPKGPGTNGVPINADLKKELWRKTQSIHKGDRSAIKAVEQFLWDENYMGDTETLQTLPANRLSEIIAKLP